MPQRVLLIEDDVFFAEILKESLEQDSDIVVMEMFHDEQAAAERFKRGLTDFDCVLLDLQLPRSRQDRTINSSAGLNLVHDLRQTHRYWGTIVVLTNSRAFADGKGAIDAGCDAYLCKNTKLAETGPMMNELRVALRGDVLIVSREMRYIFFRQDVTPKEAHLMDLVAEGYSWEEIARKLNYKTSKVAANVADRIFDKILISEGADEDGGAKRRRAVDAWRQRAGRPG